MIERVATRTPPARTRRALPLLAPALACLLALQLGAPLLLAASADEESDKSGAESTEEASTPKPGDRVFTNDDLRRYRSRAKVPANVAIVVDMTAQKPGEAPAPESMDPAVKQGRIDGIQEEIHQAEERLRAIDARTRSVHNIFLPRPKLSEEERHAEAGLDSRQILDVLNAERATLQARLTELRAELQALTRTPATPAPGELPLVPPPATEPAQTETPAAEPPRP